MKNLLVLVALTIVLVSCTKQEITENDVTNLETGVSKSSGCMDEIVHQLV